MTGDALLIALCAWAVFLVLWAVVWVWWAVQALQQKRTLRRQAAAAAKEVRHG